MDMSKADEKDNREKRRKEVRVAMFGFGVSLLVVCLFSLTEIEFNYSLTGGEHYYKSYLTNFRKYNISPINL